MFPSIRLFFIIKSHECSNLVSPNRGRTPNMIMKKVRRSRSFHQIPCPNRAFLGHHPEAKAKVRQAGLPPHWTNSSGCSCPTHTLEIITHVQLKQSKKLIAKGQLSAHLSNQKKVWSPLPTLFSILNLICCFRSLFLSFFFFPLQKELLYFRLLSNLVKTTWPAKWTEL